MLYIKIRLILSVSIIKSVFSLLSCTNCSISNSIFLTMFFIAFQFSSLSVSTITSVLSATCSIVIQVIQSCASIFLSFKVNTSHNFCVRLFVLLAVPPSPCIISKSSYRNSVCFMYFGCKLNVKRFFETFGNQVLSYIPDDPFTKGI